MTLLDFRSRGYYINALSREIVADGTTDDTAAWQALIAEVGSYASAVSTRSQPRPAILFPYGRSKITSPLSVGFRGLRVYGPGGANALFDYQGSSDTGCFEMGAFSTSPADLFGGAAQGYTFDGVGFIDSANLFAADGTRTRYGVRDNGSGDGTLNNVYFGGLKYGVCMPYGSDFTWLTGCRFDSCDVGLYAALGSHQSGVDRTEFYNCVEGAVLMRATEFKLNRCWFINGTGADVTVESAAHRLGVAGAASVYDQVITIGQCWFESQAGNNARVNARHIYLNGVNEAIQFINIDDSWCEGSGPSTNAGQCFLEMVNATKIKMRRMIYAGHGLDYIVKRPASSILRVEDFKIAEGASSTVLGTDFSDDYSEGLDIVNTLAEVATAAPTTGYHSKGAIVRNANAVSGQPMGWICTTPGKAGTFAYSALPNVP